MVKRILSFLVASVLLLACAPAFAAADSGLPFELTAPQYVTAVWAEGSDSPTTTNFTYSLSNEMTAFFKDMENAHYDGTIDQFMENIGCDDIWMNVQIDWALDDVNDPVSGWHYTEYWDGDEYFGIGRDSDGNCRVSDWDVVEWGLNNATETVQDVWITRGVPNDDRWYGNPDTHTPGVKDQLREGQYVYDDSEGGMLYIDYAEHTMYFRARFVVTVRRDGSPDEYHFSDWSAITSVGKDAAAFEPLTKADLPAPVITGLRMTDKEFNDNPIVAFTLAVPDELARHATEAEANGGGITVEIWARVKGDPEFTELQGDWTIRAGEMEAALFSLANEERPHVPKDSIVELRCRYRYDHSGYIDECIYSDWSKTISFGTDDVDYHTGPGDNGPGAPEEPEDPAKQTCPLCHFCPRPLGLCIFIWLIIIIALAVVIAIIIAVSKKKKNK